MYKNIFYYIIIILTCHSCQFNQSVEKDLVTGAYSRGNGIGCEEITIEISDKIVRRNEFIHGEKVTIVFNNINGLVSKDNKLYPKMSIDIVQNEKDTINSNSNVLDHLKDGTAIKVLKLTTFFRTILPYKNGETYKAHIKISDENGDGTFTYILPFTVKKNELLKTETKDLNYTDIYLWDENEKQPVFQKNINAAHLLVIVFEGIDGLTLKNEKVYPIFSLDVVDNDNTKIISEANLFRNFEDVGIDPEKIKQQISSEITFTKGTFNNPYTLIATVKDKYSDKQITTTTELNIE